MRNVLFVIAVLMFGFSANAQQEKPVAKKKIDGVQYELYSDGTAAVRDICEVEGAVEIREYVEHKGKQYTVTRLVGPRYHSDMKNSRLVELLVPNTVSNIERRAFFNCVTLKKVQFLRGLDSIPECAFMGCENLEEIFILDMGTRIGNAAFNSCKKLKKLVITDGVKVIDKHAFVYAGIETLELPNSVEEVNCDAISSCYNLKHLVVPDKPFRFVDYDYQHGPLAHCPAIESVRGQTVKYPTYFCNYLGHDTPYGKKFYGGINTTFSYFAEPKVLEHIEKWQQKREYESTAQWQKRVTEQNRQKEVADKIAQLKSEYIEKRKPKELFTTLGTYDADYGIQPINAAYIDNTFYIGVPVAEAQAMKQDWSNAVVTPEYGIVDDHFAVLSCTVTYNGKTYTSPNDFSQLDNSDVAITLSPLQLDLGSGNDAVNRNAAPERVNSPSVQIADNSLDMNIPTTSLSSENTFAVIIGNENYLQVSKVDYANNDAKVFAAYCQKTLGLPEKNVRSYHDATYAMMMSAIADIKRIAAAYRGDINVLFYYAGHGVPNETNHSAFLLPVDVDGSQTELCLGVDKLYQELASMNVRRVVVLMDACFSGSQRGEGMLASARGVSIKAKPSAPQGNMLVFTAATGDQTAYPYKEMGHGLFTYFLLKKLQDTKGAATIGDIVSYVSEKVEQQSVVVNGRSQTPTFTSSSSIPGNWREWTLY